MTTHKLLVTLTIADSPGDAHPVEWDWHSLLDLGAYESVEVVRAPEVEHES